MTNPFPDQSESDMRNRPTETFATLGIDTSPDLPQPQVEAESVDTPDFDELLLSAIREHTEMPTFGSDPTAGYRNARAALIAHIDSIITARVAAAERQAYQDALNYCILYIMTGDADDSYLTPEHVATFKDAIAASQVAPAIPGHLREFVEAIAKHHNGVDNQERLYCYGCEADLDDKEPHKPDCIVLRAESLLSGQAAPAKAEGNLLQAVERLIKAKGRYHTEQNYVALVAAYDEAVAAPSTPAKEPTA